MIRWWPFRKKRTLKVGDPAPDGPTTGAIIAVDPATNRITAIFIP